MKAKLIHTVHASWDSAITAFQFFRRCQHTGLHRAGNSHPCGGRVEARYASLLCVLRSLRGLILQQLQAGFLALAFLHERICLNFGTLPFPRHLAGLEARQSRHG